jgi:diguanylate cyclase (GGDEF)-like protein/PAS domain S-box-containing protein
MTLGGFSIIDTQPRTEFNAEERECLEQFAELTVLLMEHRLYPEQLARVENEIVRANERFKLATQATTEGIWDWDSTEDSLYMSANVRAIVGEEAVDSYTQIATWMDRVHPADMDHVMQFATLQQNRQMSFYDEYRVRHNDGGWRWIANRGIVLRDSGGRPVRLVGAVVDITQRKTVDVLTGLYKRVHLLGHMEQMMGEGNAGTLALYVIDLDSFKLVNSGLGRTSGDNVLKKVGLRLATFVSSHPDNMAARISGDEFVVVLANRHNESEVLQAAEELSVLLGRPIALGERQVSLSVSIGAANCANACADASEFLQCAEIALRESKLQGSGKRLLFSEKMRHGVLRQIELLSALRDAIANEELEVYYQPKLHLTEKKVTGFEALVRWRHPDLGMVPAEEFIAIAERFDLIVELGSFVLTRSIAQLAEWRERGLVNETTSMAVNLSAHQLKDSRLTSMLEGLLEKYAIPPSCLSLEVTEGVLITDADRANEILEQLKRTGVQLELDDFGTGYSSLSYLQRFPFDGLKIDRSFVMNMMQSREKAALVRSIVALGQTLHLHVIAEGIETPEHLSMLQEMGCTFGQGYLFSEPLPASQIDSFLSATPVLRMAAA